MKKKEKARLKSRAIDVGKRMLHSFIKAYFHNQTVIHKMDIPQIASTFSK